jgi:hypothetical protein
MSECGIKLLSSRVYVAPGAYAAGFLNVSLDGAAIPVSASPVFIPAAAAAASGFHIARPSPSQLDIVTPDVSFSLLNSDRFVNIERASVRSAGGQQAEGLLGQTAQPGWEVLRGSHEWRQHIEQDYLLQDDDLFSDAFTLNRYRPDTAAKDSN